MSDSFEIPDVELQFMPVESRNEHFQRDFSMMISFLPSETVNEPAKDAAGELYSSIVSAENPKPWAVALTATSVGESESAEGFAEGYAAAVKEACEENKELKAAVEAGEWPPMCDGGLLLADAALENKTVQAVVGACADLCERESICPRFLSGARAALGRAEGARPSKGQDVSIAVAALGTSVEAPPGTAQAIATSGLVDMHSKPGSRSFPADYLLYVTSAAGIAPSEPKTEQKPGQARPPYSSFVAGPSGVLFHPKGDEDERDELVTGLTFANEDVDDVLALYAGALFAFASTKEGSAAPQFTSPSTIVMLLAAENVLDVAKHLDSALDEE